MKNIDLHVHSSFSDGSETTETLVQLAIAANLSAFALTDHDTTDGYKSLYEAAKRHNIGLPSSEQLEVLPGVEISAAYKNKDIHILGLLIDPNNTDFNALLKSAEKERISRNIKMIDNLKQKAGLDISYDEIVALSPNSIITRAHFGKYLVDKKIVNDYPSAFEKYLGDDTPYYVARNFTSPKEAIEGIIRAGGVPVLAHPIIYRLPVPELERLVDTLISYGLRGIETIYSSHSKQDENYVRELAKRKGLIITGGSDFHGRPKPAINIGIGRGNLNIPYEILEDLRAEQRKLSAS
ncbi:MAG: PHP domain-containing protein [Catonella sp.]|uniref:PHP domain-containing protein n=1 Tax=Catonella sp. TaxID=2382125 RepID=UPI003FA114E3